MDHSPMEDAHSGSPENQVVTWINQLDFANAQKKVTLLRQIQETLIHQCPHAIPVYLDDILCYVNDRNQEVKKCLVAFIEEISKIRIDLLPRTAPNLQLLLMDTVVAVQKRVIQAASIVYKNGFVWMCKSTRMDNDMRKAWEVLNHIKLNILNLIDCENEGIRTNSIKFLEGIIILQTYRDDDFDSNVCDYALDDLPPYLEFIHKKKLEEESSHIFDLLVKFHNSQHISGVNLMACMSALCEVAKFRPKFLPKVIHAFSSLQSSLPPTLSQSQTNSVKKHLKMRIVNLIKHPSSSEMIPQLIQTLTDLGVTSQELNKIIPKSERKYKRINDIRNGEGVKRPRIDSPQSNSQGSDRSDIEPMVDETEVTEKSLLEGLQNLDSIVNLVMASMKNLPDEFPPYFKALYEPISNSGVIVQHSSLAKLLMRLINSSDNTTVENTQVTSPEENEKIKLKNALAKLESSKLESKIEGVLSKLIDNNVGEESARDKEIFSNFEKEKDKEKEICPPTPTIPKLIQRVKTIKLQEVTKPLSQNVRERLISGAVERILKAESTVQDSNAYAGRMKMLSTFAVSFGDQVRETILAFILKDVPARIDLAMSWMYEEYCYMQGFNRKIVATSNVSKIDEKSYQNYNNLMCSIITDLMELNDPTQEVLRENLFRKMYLEAPMVTNDAIMYLKQISQEEEKYTIGLNLLRDLMLYQPTKGTKYITALLPVTVNKNNIIREAAIERVVELYKNHNESLRKAIDKHASLHLGFIALPDPPKDILDWEFERTPNSGLWDDDLYKICLQPYLAILPYNHELLHELCRIYIGVGADGKRCVLRLIETPIRQLGAENPTLLSVIEECPKGSETLITRIIHILTEKTSPSQELVAKVRDLYIKRVPDVRFLIPVLTGLTKNEILGALPKLIKLNPAVVREAFNKLWTCHDTLPPLTPSELLISLHLLDTTKVELKYIIKATSLCFSEKQAYTCEVLADVLQKLVDQPQLPVLLMRSVLQALSLYPTRLSAHVIGILHQLITKQVWEQKIVWEGFLKCCQRLSPQSLTVLIMLPVEPFRLALKTCPDLHSTLIQGLPNLTSVPHYVNLVLSEFKTTDDNDDMMSISGDMMGKLDSSMDSIPNEPLPPGME